MKSNSYNVIVIRVGGLRSSASYNRLLTIIKMLEMSETKVICLNIRNFNSGYSWESNETQKVYSADSVQFIDMHDKTKKATTLIKLWLSFKGIRNAIGFISRHSSTSTVIFLHTTSIIDYLCFFCVSRVLNLRLTTDRTEYPHYIREVKIKNYLYCLFFDRWKFKMIDRITVISDSLFKYYGERLRRDSRIIKIPMTVDMSRFSPNLREVNSLKYIGYAGSLDTKKDGVDNLIHAFNRISKEYFDIELWIAGSTTDQELCQYLKSIAGDKVKFVGFLNRETVVQFLINAEILVLPRPNSIQAEGGFPSKLGEYLSAGVPTIVTDVGEISKYLRHNENTFLINPNSIDELYEGMNQILANYDFYKNVAENGRELAKNNFDLSNYSLILNKFMMD